MTALTNMVFLIQFVGFFGIISYALWNSLKKIDEENIDNKTPGMLLIASIFLYGIGMVSALVGYEETLVVQLIRFQSWFLPISLILMIVQYAKIYMTKSRSNTVQPFMSQGRK